MHPGAGKLDTALKEYISQHRDVMRKHPRIIEIAEAAIQEVDRYEGLSVIDELTGLYNFRKMQEDLRKEIMRSYRSRAPLSIVYSDIDHFKKINDTLGHGFGDDLLIRDAYIMVSNIRGSDTAYRKSGDEFVIILPETDSSGALKVAKNIKEEGHSVVIPRLERPLTFSQGIASYVWKDGDVPPLQSDLVSEDVLSAADSALYNAKQKGRDRIAVEGRDEMW